MKLKNLVFCFSIFFSLSTVPTTMPSLDNKYAYQEVTAEDGSKLILLPQSEYYSVKDAIPVVTIAVLLLVAVSIYKNARVYFANVR